MRVRDHRAIHREPWIYIEIAAGAIDSVARNFEERFQNLSIRSALHWR
jgi:hypothetical protein